MSRAADAWGDESARAVGAIASTSGSAGGLKSKTALVNVVRDDWELDDEEEDDMGRSVDLQNKRIWEDANLKEHHPMPSVIISRGSSVSSTAPTLPLNQLPAMRILKRPSPSVSPSQSSTNVNLTVGKTFQDREARYQAARERIFGGSNDEPPENGEKKKNSKKPASSTAPPLPATKVVREPRGPNAQGADGITPESKGFGERKAKRPPYSTASSSSTTSMPSFDTPV